MTKHARFLSNAILAALIATGTLSLSACNTIEGAGQDIKAGGEVISKTAKDAKKEIEE